MLGLQEEAEVTRFDEIKDFVFSVAREKRRTLQRYQTIKWQETQKTVADDLESRKERRLSSAFNFLD